MLGLFLRQPSGLASAQVAVVAAIEVPVDFRRREPGQELLGQRLAGHQPELVGVPVRA